LFACSNQLSLSDKSMIVWKPNKTKLMIATQHHKRWKMRRKPTETGNKRGGNNYIGTIVGRSGENLVRAANFVKIVPKVHVRAGRPVASGAHVGPSQHRPRLGPALSCGQWVTANGSQFGTTSHNSHRGRSCQQDLLRSQQQSQTDEVVEKKVKIILA